MQELVTEFSLRGAPAAPSRPLGSRVRPFPTLVGAVLLLAATSAGATTIEYSLDLPANRKVAFEVDLNVRHRGRLILDAEWSGGRVLSFRLEPPDRTREPLRRSGPAPQRMEVDIQSDGQIGHWTLSIRGLHSRQSSSGVVRVLLPDESLPLVENIDEPAVPSIDPMETPPWGHGATAPPGLDPGPLAFFEGTESFRRQLVEAQHGQDGFAWQWDCLRYLVRRRDVLVSAGPSLDPATQRMLRRIVRIVDQVEQLRASDDPLLAGPAPEDRLQRRAWIRLREQRVAPIEQDLDNVLHDLRSGHAPGLESEDWLVRFLSCVAVSERYFEQRGRFGIEQADNREIALGQWGAIVLASEALRHLAALAPD